MPTLTAAEECLSATRNDSLGGMPLAVISTVHHPPNYTTLQRKLLSLSSDSKQFMAVQSFHAVTIEQPEVIVAAIQQVVEAVRHSTTLK